MEMNFDTIILFIPYIIVYLSLVLISWHHIFKHRRFKRGNMVLWLCVTLLVHFIGPILYFTIGKED